MAEMTSKFLVGNTSDLASKKVVSTGENEGVCELPELQTLGGKRQE